MYENFARFFSTAVSEAPLQMHANGTLGKIQPNQTDPHRRFNIGPAKSLKYHSDHYRAILGPLWHPDWVAMYKKKLSSLLMLLLLTLILLLMLFIDIWNVSEERVVKQRRFTKTQIFWLKPRQCLLKSQLWNFCGNFFDCSFKSPIVNGNQRDARKKTA